MKITKSLLRTIIKEEIGDLRFTANDRKAILQHLKSRDDRSDQVLSPEGRARMEKLKKKLGPERVKRILDKGGYARLLKLLKDLGDNPIS